MTTYSYSTAPLTLILPNEQSVILSSHQGYDLMRGNVILPDSLTSSSTTDDSSSADAITTLFSSDILGYIMILLCLFIFSFVIMNIQMNKESKKSSLDSLIQRHLNAANAILPTHVNPIPSIRAVHPELPVVNQSEVSLVSTMSNDPPTKENSIVPHSESSIPAILSPSTDTPQRRSRLEREKSKLTKTPKDQIPITETSALLPRKSKSSKISSAASSKSPKLTRDFSKQMFPRDGNDGGKRDEGDDSDGSDFDSFSFSSEEIFSDL